MPNKTKIANLVKTASLACALAILAGCATAKKQPALFWPASPDPPRVQYLKAIKDSTDVEELKSWSLLDTGKDEKRGIAIVKPYGIAVNKGKIYLVDAIQADIIILDLPGKKASTISGNKAAGKLKKPINVAVDDDGCVYVTDTGRGEVLKYGPDGEFRKAIGTELAMKPTGIAVDDLYLYVLDNSRNTIQLFDRVSGAKIRTIGADVDEKARLYSPLGIGLDGKGGVYVTNLNGRILHYDRDGHPLRSFGRLGTAISDFNRPRAVVFDKDGLMYVVDAAPQNVRILNDMFQLLMSFGEPGTRGSLNVPSGIAISEDNLAYYQQFAEPDFILDKVIFVVSQFGDHKISIYGLGRKKGVDYEAQVRERQEEISKKEEEIRKKKEEMEKKAQEQKEKEGASGEKSGTAPSAAPAPAGKQ